METKQGRKRGWLRTKSQRYSPQRTTGGKGVKRENKYDTSEHLLRRNSPVEVAVKMFHCPVWGREKGGGGGAVSAWVEGLREEQCAAGNLRLSVGRGGAVSALLDELLLFTKKIPKKIRNEGKSVACRRQRQNKIKNK
jgi:hypothetical protein